MLLKTGGVLFILAVLLSRIESNVSWHHDQLNTGYSRFDSVRLFYPPQDLTTDLGVELVKNQSGLWGYLYVSQREVPRSQLGNDEAFVIYSVESISKDFLAKRMKGGHCLLIPSEVLHEMIVAWQAGLSVRIETEGGFHSIIGSSGFSKALDKSKRPAWSTTQ